MHSAQLYIYCYIIITDFFNMGLFVIIMMENVYK